MTHNNILYNLSAATLLIMLAFMAYGAYLLFWDFKTISLFDKSGNELTHEEIDDVTYWYGLDIQDKIIKQDSVAFYAVDFCRHTDAPAKVEKHLVDGILLELPEDLLSGGSFEKGCKSLNIPFYISDKVPEGQYRMRVRVQYDINVFQKPVVFFLTEPFMVVK